VPHLRGEAEKSDNRLLQGKRLIRSRVNQEGSAYAVVTVGFNLGGSAKISYIGCSTIPNISVIQPDSDVVMRAISGEDAKNKVVTDSGFINVGIRHSAESGIVDKWPEGGVPEGSYLWE
jgi:hypothetical protein